MNLMISESFYILIIFCRVEKQNSVIHDLMISLENSHVSIPIIEVDANRFLRPVYAEIQDKTKSIIRFVKIFETYTELNFKKKKI